MPCLVCGEWDPRPRWRCWERCLPPRPDRAWLDDRGRYWVTTCEPCEWKRFLSELQELSYEELRLRTVHTGGVEGVTSAYVWALHGRNEAEDILAVLAYSLRWWLQQTTTPRWQKEPLPRR